MRAYEVFLNGKRLCVAGIGKDGYISAYVTYRSEPNDTWVDVLGHVNNKNFYVRWTRKDLCVGDEVLVKVVDRKSVDKYKVIRRNKGPTKKEIESMKRAVRAQAKAFGWKIEERHRAK